MYARVFVYLHFRTNWLLENMPFEFWYTLALLAVMSFLLIMEWFETEIVIYAVLLFLILGNVITVQEAFAGLSNEGMLTIALLFIVAGALHHTGMITQLNQFIFGNHTHSITSKLLRVMFPTCAISAFMNNTPLVSMLIPAVRSWTEKHDLAPSKFFIPISYAAILGGMCTLIGTSTNLIVHGMMLDYGMRGIGLFEISKAGAPLALTGILLIAFLGRRLLPDRKEPLIELGENTREFVIELKVTEAFQKVGHTVEEAGLRHLKGLFLFQIERGGKVITPASPDEKILVGDRLFFTGLPKTILELQKTPGLQLIKESSFDLKQYSSAEIKTYEAVVAPGSPLVGKNVRENNFRAHYEAVIIAIHRNGERIRRKIGDVVLRPGDTLLLLAGKNFRQKWYHSNNFCLVSTTEEVPSRPQWQGYFAAAMFLLMLGLTLFNILPLLTAAALATIALVVMRAITPSEARQMIDFRVLLIIAGSFGIAAGLKNSGVADYVAGLVVTAGGQFGLFGVLGGVFFVTSFYNTLISSNATAAILFPVAVTAAAQVGADPRPFAIAVAIAAAGSFATPISYQTNLMVYGPGGYRFTDFLKIGVPLQLIIGVLAVFLINWLYF